MVSERLDNLDGLLDIEDVLAGGEVQATAIRGLLDEEAWRVLRPLLPKIVAVWNPGCHDPQPVPLDLECLESCPPLDPMGR